MNNKNEKKSNLIFLEGCTLTTNCITLQDGQTAKICVDNGQTKIMIENKDAKEEEPKFKKGDVLSCTENGSTWILIFKGIDKEQVISMFDYYCMLNPFGDIITNASSSDFNWNYATEKEKRSLFLAMLNQGMFWDEKKMKVRTLKDGDIVTIEDAYNCLWYSIFKEIKDGKFCGYSYLSINGNLHHGLFGDIDVILHVRYSTTEERQTLFDKIEEKEHKKWNAETKKFTLQAYKEEELKDNFPKTWEEFITLFLHESISEKSAKAHYALMQLEQLRNYYRDGWLPDWENDEHKYVIYNCKNKIIFNTDIDGTSHFLSFPTMELCEKFYNNFKELIEIAKDLI